MDGSASTSREDELFNQYYNQYKYGTDKPPVLTIPRFYDKAPDDDESLAQKLREEARSRFLQSKSQQLLDDTELKEVWNLLEENYTPPIVDEEKMIGYDNFKKLVNLVPKRAKQFFEPSVFGNLQQRDPYGRVCILNLFNYIMRKTWLRRSRIGLSLYDVTGQGYLTEKDLELYISELMPTMPQLQRLEKSFHSFYVCTAVRKFLFFLDPKSLGKVRISDILASGFLDDLLELRDAPNMDNESKDTDTPTDTPRSSIITKMEQNWFSAANSLRVYGTYLNLDTDRNGMLSQDELCQYGGGTLTRVFVQRVFQEYLTYEGEMDYKAYLDFILAMENKRHRASLQYFFRILDVRQKGYLDAFAINYFFRYIQKQLVAEDQPLVIFEDMKDEIFDMVKPVDPFKITLSDLIQCKQGDTVVGVLTDMDGFWKYENREYLATEPDEEAEC